MNPGSSSGCPKSSDSFDSCGSLTPNVESKLAFGSVLSFALYGAFPSLSVFSRRCFGCAPAFPEALCRSDAPGDAAWDAADATWSSPEKRFLFSTF